MQQAAPPPAEFDAYSATYDAAVNDSIAFSGLTVDFFTAAKATLISNLLAEHFPGRAALSVLDIGCGVGNYHGLLPDHVDIHGVDVSAPSIDVARQRHPDAHYQVYDGGTLPYDTASFDAAYTICVMHHVPPGQWPHFAAEMLRVLRPGGIAMVFEHNPYNPLTRRVVSQCEFDANAVLLTASTTQRLLSTAGFDQTDSRYILCVPVAGSLPRRIDTMLAGVPLGAQYYTLGRKP